MGASVQGVFSGVFPVKCNHDRALLECILEAGRPFNYGLEVGSRAELLMAMSMIGRSPGALLICNGYKDAAFMRLVRSPDLGFIASRQASLKTPGGHVAVTFQLWLGRVCMICEGWHEARLQASASENGMFLLIVRFSCMQAVHCWELGIKAIVVLEQFQVNASFMTGIFTNAKLCLYCSAFQRTLTSCPLSWS